MSASQSQLPEGYAEAPAEVEAAIQAGYLAWVEKRYAEAREGLTKAMTLSQAARSPWGAIRAKHHLANTLFNLREDAESRRVHEEVLAEGLALNFPWAKASSLGNIGHIDAVEGRLEDARAAYQASIETYEAMGGEAEAQSVRRALAYVERLAAEGRLTEAFAHLRGSART